MKSFAQACLIILFSSPIAVPVYALEPISDEPFLQEAVTKVFAGKEIPGDGILRIAVDKDGLLWAANRSGLYAGQFGKTLSPYPFIELNPNSDAAHPPVLIADTQGSGQLLYASGNLIYLIQPGSQPIKIEAPQDFGTATDAAIPDRNRILVSSTGGLWISNGNRLERVPNSISSQFNAVAAGSGSIFYAATSEAVYAFDSKQVRHWWVGGQIDKPATDLAVKKDGTLLVGHLEGVNILSPDGLWSRWGIRERIPYHEVTSLLTGKDGDVWIGTTQGLIRKRQDVWDYDQGGRWMCSNGVTGIAINGDDVYVASDQGVAKIAFVPTTLEKKAAHYDEITRKRHWRHGLVSDSRLREPNNLESSFTHDNDNDGLWTSIYLAAQCYRYAVTKDADALQQAKACFAAMERLETINGRPGFISRSYLGPEETVPKKGEWHPSPVEQGWYWKADTSSDEYAGHAFVYPLYYDLIDDDAERAKAKDLMARILDHIIAHDYTLTDLDGKPTRWGVWTPEKLNETQSWAYERGLNSLQIISALTCGYHMTGNPKYLEHKRKLIVEYGYADNILNQKMTYPPEENHSDDELAFLPYYGLLKYETDPALKEIWKKSIHRSWEAQRQEKASLWEFIYGSAENDDFNLPGAVETLRNWPLDLRTWGVDVLGRTDTTTDQVPDRFGRPQVLEILPVDERPVAKWNSNPYSGGSTQWDAHEEEDGGAFLLPYWMARYYGWIVSPNN